MASVHEAAAADEMVTCPPHYQAGPYQCKDVEKALSDKMEGDDKQPLSAYESRLYLAAFEYVWRAPFKDNFSQDLRKAAQDLLELADLWECR